MNFLKGSIQKYHEKKLKEAIKELKYHTSIKNKIESQLKSASDQEIKNEIQKQLDNQNKLISIWENNIKKINKQLKKFN